jgi:hypothetical protein
MKTHILSFKPDGTARLLWTDALPLAALGSLQVERASTIEFNNNSGMWEVRLGNDPLPKFMARSRQACIDWEIATLQCQL